MYILVYGLAYCFHLPFLLDPQLLNMDPQPALDCFLLSIAGVGAEAATGGGCSVLDNRLSMAVGLSFTERS